MEKVGVAVGVTVRWRLPPAETQGCASSTELPAAGMGSGWPPGKNRLPTRWAALPLPERKAESDRGAWLALISRLLEEEMKAAINCTRRVVCAA